MVPAGAVLRLSATAIILNRHIDVIILAAVSAFALLPEPWRSNEIVWLHFGGFGGLAMGGWVPLPFPPDGLCEKKLDSFRGRWHRRQAYSAALSWAALLNPEDRLRLLAA